VVERIRLAAKAAAVGAGDDADAAGWQTEHPGQGAVHIVWCLGGRVEGQPVVVLGHRHRRVLLHRQMGVALVEHRVLEHQVRLGQATVDVAE
jgi:hypothetical protein